MTATQQLWDEVFEAGRTPRPQYAALWQRLNDLKPSELRVLNDRMEATLRELGVTFSSTASKNRPFGSRPWLCDLLPHLVVDADWKLIASGLRQRLKAFEFFLRDIYQHKQILRDGVIPFQPVLGSPYRYTGCHGVQPSGGHYLHLSGICLGRDRHGQLQVKGHHFSHAFGLSYMMQNRRVLARVAPELFSDFSVASIAETPTQILEYLRSIAHEAVRDPMVVMLSPGTGSPVYSEHSFLARRMGVPLVQSGDLLVIDDHVCMKTISGLEPVDVIYTRVADAWLDPLAYPESSSRGVPGLVHCLRKGTVQLVNAVGSQLADDRAILTFSQQIIRYYLGETPVLPTLTTYWLGDIDQREYVLENLDQYRVLPLTGERVFGNRRGKPPNEAEEKAIRTAIRQDPTGFVAQPFDAASRTVMFQGGKPAPRLQDHLVFAIRDGDDFDLFPGMLTRLSGEDSLYTAFNVGGGSKDSWVPGEDAEPVTQQSSPRQLRELRPPERRVMSRVAEAFYWMGRYLERSYNLAQMIQIIETVETEELTAAERKLYRPVWNQLLPPLDQGSSSRRSMASPMDRYRLVLQTDMPGCLHSTLQRVRENAESIRDVISPETWTVITQMESIFNRTKFHPTIEEEKARKITRSLAESVVSLVPQCFGVAESSMLADDGLRFCRIGQFLERAIFTSNAITSISGSLLDQVVRPLSLEHSTEIELSAFLRLLGTRDAYRRVYQMRAEPLPVLELLCQSPDAPRSLVFALLRCVSYLDASLPSEIPSTQATLQAFNHLIEELRAIDWTYFFEPEMGGDLLSHDEPEMLPEEEVTRKIKELALLLENILKHTLELHHVIADSFLNHQAQIARHDQPLLQGFG